MSRADLLLLDAPTSGLDPLMEREFRRCVAEAKAAGQTVFLSSHILSEVEALADPGGHPARRTARRGRHAFIAALAVLTIILAGRRDLGASTLCSSQRNALVSPGSIPAEST